jgi:hypothetical protein
MVVLGVDLRLLRGQALQVLRLQEMDADAVVVQPVTRARALLDDTGTKRRRVIKI